MTPSLEVLRQERDERRCRAARAVTQCLIAMAISVAVGALATAMMTQINHVLVNPPEVIQ